jgi:predicted outer membrane repeat protein
MEKINLKFFKISIIFLVLMIFSVGFVFAEDTNQTSDSLEMTDGDVVSADEVKTYADLFNDIESSANLTADYAFNMESDKYDRMKIPGSNDNTYHINGNNHAIDGSNKAGVFRLVNGEFEIKDLTIKNCGKTAIILENSTLTLNNVKFIDNKDNSTGAAIYLYESQLNANNCLFENNDAPEGSAIFAEKSNLYIKQTTFTNKNPIKWSLIYAVNAVVDVQNSLFENATSTYATAIYGSGSKMDITNSIFSNLRAAATGGAVAAKKLGTYKDDPVSLNIKNCKFINVSSAKNGGAIYIDVNGADGNANEWVIVRETVFDKCYSEFGGAILQLGGRMNIIDSNFTNNKATYSGGAVYTSDCTFYAGGCLFKNNTLEYKDMQFSNGGAMYLDYGTQKIEICDFINNSAFEGGAIYSFASYIELLNSYFENNKEGLHGNFLKEGSYYKNVNTKTGDKFDYDEENFATIVDFPGKKIVLNPIAVTGSVNDAKFDLRDFGVVTPVEDQGRNGACWAFGTTGAFESAFLKATGIKLDISNNNIQNSGIRYSIYGKPSMTEGGYIFGGLSYILSWLGVVDSENDKYDELGKISPIIFTDNSYHISDAAILDPVNITSMKDALIKYGALTVFVNGANPNNQYYNQDTKASYCNNQSLGNHFVTVVGWDDNFSRDNFKINPGHDGAWICKNSWGTDWGDNGYFYLSYYDAPLRFNYAVGYIINNTEVYDRLYQYDVAAFEGDYYKSEKGNDVIYKNTYTSIEGEMIAGVGTYFFTANQNYKITIFVNGKQVYTQSGKSKFSGFETVKLNKKVAVGKNTKFTVQIQTKYAPVLENSRQYFEKGTSIYQNGKNIIDYSAQGKAVCIKVYTFKNKNAASNPTQHYNPNKAVIKGYAEGAKVTLSKNGASIASGIVKDGKVEFDQNITPGNYSITVEYDDDEFVDVFEIYSSIDIDDEYTRTYNSKAPIDVVFFDLDDECLNNTNITGSIDGKKFTLTTDVNGSVSIPLPKLSIGKHELILYNPNTEEEVSADINIVSRFSSVKNIAMDYYDGTKFKVRIYDDYGNPVGKNVKVTIKIKNKSYNRYTDSKGYISFKIPNKVTPGKYTLKATYKGQTISKTVKVKQVLKAAKKTVTVKKSAKKLVLKATLKTSKNKAIKYKKVSFKVNGKTYSAKTNKKGIVQVTIKKAAIKKLKAGKKYTVKITYLKNTVKTTLKIKR